MSFYLLAFEYVDLTPMPPRLAARVATRHVVQGILVLLRKGCANARHLEWQQQDASARARAAMRVTYVTKIKVFADAPHMDRQQLDANVVGQLVTPATYVANVASKG